MTRAESVEHTRPGRSGGGEPVESGERGDREPALPLGIGDEDDGVHEQVKDETQGSDYIIRRGGSAP